MGYITFKISVKIIIIVMIRIMIVIIISLHTRILTCAKLTLMHLLLSIGITG